MRGASSSVSRDKQTPPLIAITCSTIKMLTALDCPSDIDGKARYWSKIAMFAPGSGFQSEYCHDVYTENKNGVTRC